MQDSQVAQWIVQEMQETWVRSLGWEDPLEEEKATHSSILVAEIPGAEGMVGYSSWGCEKLDTTQHVHLHEVVKIFIFVSNYFIIYFYPLRLILFQITQVIWKAK